MAIPDAALVAAAVLSDRYITGRQLPDKAIDLIDEASSRLRMEHESSPEEIDVLRKRLLGVHWRLRDHTLRPRRMDFAAFARDCWFGPLDLTGLWHREISLCGCYAYDPGDFAQTMARQFLFSTWQKMLFDGLPQGVQAHLSLGEGPGNGILDADEVEPVAGDGEGVDAKALGLDVGEVEDGFLVLVGAVGDALALGAVAVPGVAIQTRWRKQFAQLCRRRVVQARLDDPLVKHHLVANQLPLGLRSTHAVDQKVVLLFTNHGAVGLAGHTVGGVHRGGSFNVAVKQSCIEHEHVNHVTELHTADNFRSLSILT